MMRVLYHWTLMFSFIMWIYLNEKGCARMCDEGRKKIDCVCVYGSCCFFYKFYMYIMKKSVRFLCTTVEEYITLWINMANVNRLFSSYVRRCAQFSVPTSEISIIIVTIIIYTEYVCVWSGYEHKRVGLFDQSQCLQMKSKVYVCAPLCVFRTWQERWIKANIHEYWCWRPCRQLASIVC